ncbi:hypothetical protein JHK87_030988 [Glycine soja]|nr:hypothetical protein JHK87_030988 [Glycine soja]
MTETKAAEDAKEMVLLEEEKCAKKMVCMWGYLPRASPKKSPILSLVPVNLSDPSLVGDSWKDVCGGEKGKLITWGSMDDEGQSYLILGKHGIGQYIASNGGVVAYEELAPYLDIEST